MDLVRGAVDGHGPGGRDSALLARPAVAVAAAADRLDPVGLGQGQIDLDAVVAHAGEPVVELDPAAADDRAFVELAGVPIPDRPERLTRRPDPHGADADHQVTAV